MQTTSPDSVTLTLYGTGAIGFEMDSPTGTINYRSFLAQSFANDPHMSDLDSAAVGSVAADYAARVLDLIDTRAGWTPPPYIEEEERAETEHEQHALKDDDDFIASVTLVVRGPDSDITFQPHEPELEHWLMHTCAHFIGAAYAEHAHSLEPWHARMVSRACDWMVRDQLTDRSALGLARRWRKRRIDKDLGRPSWNLLN